MNPEHKKRESRRQRSDNRHVYSRAEDTSCDAGKFGRPAPQEAGLQRYACTRRQSPRTNAAMSASTPTSVTVGNELAVAGNAVRSAGAGSCMPAETFDDWRATRRSAGIAASAATDVDRGAAGAGAVTVAERLAALFDARLAAAVSAAVASDDPSMATS